MAVHFAGELRCRIEVWWCGKKGGFVQRLDAGGASVDPDSARVDDSPNSVRSSGLENELRSTGIHELRVFRVGNHLIHV